MLYEVITEQGALREPLPGRLHLREPRPDPRLVLFAYRARGRPVITSYSIHYTKLYERDYWFV